LGVFFGRVERGLNALAVRELAVQQPRELRLFDRYQILAATLLVSVLAGGCTLVYVEGDHNALGEIGGHEPTGLVIRPGRPTSKRGSGRMAIFRTVKIGRFLWSCCVAPN